MLLIVCKGAGLQPVAEQLPRRPDVPGHVHRAAGGIALSHLRASPLAGAAMGIGAMSVAMLGLPLTSVLLVAVILAAEGWPYCPW